MSKVETEKLDRLCVSGARVHNLKNINVEIPHGKLTVITGLSGSGKSSLAFDTIFAEGQRRYIETFSSYARQMLGNLERPDVDVITGLSPVIAIEQKTINRNPRSTIGTTTEIYDFLRLLYARVATARSYISGKPMQKFSIEKIIGLVTSNFAGHKILLLSPLVRNRKGHYQELFEQLLKKGYINVRIDGEMCELTHGMKVDRYKNHSIELVVDKLVVNGEDITRLRNSVETALEKGSGQMMVCDVDHNNEITHLSRTLMDPENGLSYRDPAPHNFSFNSPLGACQRCKGIGEVNVIDIDKIIPDRSISIAAGAIEPLGKRKDSVVFRQIEQLCERHGCTLTTPVEELPDELIEEILYGSSEKLDVNVGNGYMGSLYRTYDGIVRYIEMLQSDDADEGGKKWTTQFFSRIICPECHGDRINIEARSFYIDDKNIADLCRLDITELRKWLKNINQYLSKPQQAVAAEIIKEISARLSFLEDVGLGYLSLSRSSATLSGGESQRIRLATQIGSELVNVLYILDEPSIGLHQKDNQRLIGSLKRLRDAENSVIVVEHDRDMMLESDWIIDIGPFAGRKGGEVVFQGTPTQMLKSKTLTADYLNGTRNIPIPSTRRKGNGLLLELLGASGNNLKNVDFRLPLGTMTCVCGVSGSGKSSLISSTLQPILSRHFYRSLQEPLSYRELRGLENIDKVVTVDQTPLGRTPRSNPATYTGVFADIRALFVNLPEAKIRGYKPGRFSFNVKGGRCEVCKGNGYKTIEMNFLPDVLVPCEECGGRRYSRETLEVRFKGKSISDVLDMTINQAVEFFANTPVILKKLKVMQEVGLGYIKLGQPSSTLSGGENQRVKLANELSKRDTGKTLFILDEPTTGLHFEDIKTLLALLNRLVDKGNTVLIIEHNTDVIKSADYIFDMGPEGGAAGGEIIAHGTPEEVASGDSPTAPFLRKELSIN